MIPRLLVVNYEILEPFTYSVLSNARIARESGYVMTDPYNETGWWQNHANYLSERKSSTIIYVFLSQILGIDELTVSRLPILGFILILLCFVLAKKITGSFYAGIVFTLIINCDFLTNLVYTSISYHQLGLVFHLLFLVLLYDVISNIGKYGRSRYIALLTIFIPLYYAYYSLEFLTIVFVAIFLLLFMLIQWRTRGLAKNQGIIHSLVSLLFFTAIIFVGFDTIMAKVSDIGLSGLSMLTSLIFRTVRYEASATYNPSFNSSYLTTRTLYIQLILAVSVVFIIAALISFARKKETSIETNFSLSLFFTSIAELLIYSSLGYPNTRYFVKLMPLGVIVILTKSNLPLALNHLSTAFQKIVYRIMWLRHMIMPVILFLVLMTSYFAVTYPPVYQYVGGLYLFSSVSPSSAWLCQHLSSQQSLVAPHHSAAVTLYVAAVYGKSEFLSVNQFDNNVYIFENPNATAVGKMFTTKNYQYMALQHRSAQLPFYGAFSIVIPPVKGAISKTETFDCLNKVYDDGDNILFRYNPLIWQK